MRMILTVFTLVLVLPLTARAQTWSAAQQEVWDFELECLNAVVTDDLQARHACFHNDYVGWSPGAPVPTPYFPERDEWNLAQVNAKFMEATPLNILVHGNFAVVHYMSRQTNIQKDGSSQTIWTAWTDILLKEDGKWSWIADHGHPATPVN
jgi:hypothetical protein